ncbi:MAG: hypothetical protein KatS3mg032_0604 [Cyclobacteriaceae bacterium]|nr:MAG: hypothetical protein KatS3mg032_0604 [Cyclobacteriaceae bacterium]
MKALVFSAQFLIPAAVFAQLQLVPVQRQPQPVNYTQARITSLPPMRLPFWDDFSKSYVTDTLWDSYHTVLVSSGTALNPPTINTALFDGLDANGVPYNTILPLETGYTDSLVSRRIDLTTVPVAIRNQIFLSFFYQWGGFAENPDPSDFLTLEFRNNSGQWEPVLTLYSDNNTQLPNVFYDTAIRINQDRFYHNEFQFRFRSFGRRSGRYDVWHIDYVYLNYRTAEETGNTSISDRAMTRPFTSLFGSYYALPYTHFRDNPAAHLSSPTIEVFNLKDTTFAQVLNYTSHFRVRTFASGIENITFDNFVDFEVGLPSVPSRGRATYLLNAIPPAIAFEASADSAIITASIGINSGDNDQDYYSRYVPINFIQNDTLTFTYRLTDYYAYDDGTAEYAAGLTQAGNLAAVKYGTVNQQSDTLSGVYIYYPFTASASPNIATILVWNNQNGRPGTLLSEQTVPVRRNGNNEFTYFRFNPSVIVPDTFFIGWRQAPGGLIRIGLDSSNDTGNNMYVNTTGTWVINDLVSGSLMIRPQFGKGEVVTGVDQPTDETIAMFPNPNNGKFYLRGNFMKLEIVSVNGSLIPFEIKPAGNLMEVTAQIAAAGIYIVRCSTGQQIKNIKMLVRP